MTQVAATKSGIGLARREHRAFYWFVSPWLVGFIVFGLGPICASAVISFTRWDLGRAPHWIGLSNYRRLAHDSLFWTALKNTVYYGLGSVIFTVVVTFALALLLNQRVPGISVFRAIFYLPAVVSGVATAILWIEFLDPNYGVINSLLSYIGIAGPGWLTSTGWVIPSLILMAVWSGGTSMILYLAGLQGIPRTLYESVSMDGAGPLRKFWHITVPMMSPVILFNAVTGVIASLQAYVLILIMTNGGPDNASLVYGLYIYRTAFQDFNLGYASALAWILFLLIMLVTGLQFWGARKWVYYEGR